MDTIMENPLSPTRQQLVPFSRCKPELIGDAHCDIRDTSLARRRKLKHWKHNGLIVWNGQEQPLRALVLSLPACRITAQPLATGVCQRLLQRLQQDPFGAPSRALRAAFER